MTEDVDLSTPQDVKALRMMLPFLWPKNDLGLRVRLVLSISLLGATAAMNALAPLLFAAAVDRFVPGEVLAQTTVVVLALPLLLILSYGAVHSLGKALSEMRWALYGPIEQRVKRNVGMTVFRHLHDLSLRFHIGRRTGALSRIMDNGTRGIDNLLMATVFLILPLMTEIVIIVGVLLGKFDYTYTLIILGTFVAYGTTLVIGSEWLRKHQRRAVVEGAAAHGKAVDSLLNYETVKYFGNEEFVAGRYDESLQLVERLTIKALVSRSITGVIQVAILGLGLTGMILLAGSQVAAGTITIGGFVLVNTYLLPDHPAPGPHGQHVPQHQTGLHRGRADDGFADRGAGSEGCPRRRRVGCGRRRSGIPLRFLCLRHPAAGAARRFVYGPRRAHARAGRRQRRRQDDFGQAAVPVLRPLGRDRPVGRP